MDELPSRAKEFLGAAKGIHDAPNDPQLRARLHQSILARLPLAPPPAAGAGRGFTLAGKAKLLMALLAGTSSVGLVSWLMVARPEHPAPAPTRAVTPPALAPAVQPSPALAPEASEPHPTDATEHHTVPTAPRKRAAHDQADALTEEAQLLNQVSSLLAQHQTSGALAKLREYRARFPHPSLLEERDGLTVLARCLNEPRSPKAESAAAQFVASHPRSVLVPRIELSCHLQRAGEP